MVSKIVTLYGHLVVDTILVDFEQEVNLGGIVNVWSGLKHLNHSLTVNIRPTDIGEAIILVDKKTNQRTSRGCLNLNSSKIQSVHSDWHHIAYINQVTHNEFIHEIDTGIISADITKESPENVTPFLKYIDYLFISEEDLFMDVHLLGEMVKGWVIAHSPVRSICTNGTDKFVYDVPTHLLLNNVNVLGAGDYFASGFINAIMLGHSITDSIKCAHENTTTLLQR